MDTQLKGKKGLITGGSSGIGQAIAEALADEGVDVAVASRRPDSQVVDELKAKGVNAYGIQADVSDRESVRQMVAESVAKLGGLDLYVNNAARAIHQPVTQIEAVRTTSTLSNWLARRSHRIVRMSIL